MKYINKRLSVTVGFSENNSKKTEAQFIKANEHLGFSDDELKEAYGLVKQSKEPVVTEKQIAESKSTKNP